MREQRRDISIESQGERDPQTGYDKDGVAERCLEEPDAIVDPLRGESETLDR